MKTEEEIRAMVARRALHEYPEDLIPVHRAKVTTHLDNNLEAREAYADALFATLPLLLRCVPHLENELRACEHHGLAKVAEQCRTLLREIQTATA